MKIIFLLLIFSFVPGQAFSQTAKPDPTAIEDATERLDNLTMQRDISRMQEDIRQLKRDVSDLKRAMR